MPGQRPPPPALPDDAEMIARSIDDPELFAGLYDRHAADIHARP